MNANKEMRKVMDMLSGVFDADEGNWVTINGTHVLIGEGGEVKSGPSNLRGKSLPNAKSHTRSGGASNGSGSNKSDKALIGKTYKNDGEALKSALEDLGYTDFKHEGNYAFSAKKDGEAYQISTKPTSKGPSSKNIRVEGIVKKPSPTNGGSSAWKPDDIYLEKGWIGHRAIENQAESFLDVHLPDVGEELDEIFESRVVSRPTKSGIADVEVDYSVYNEKGKREERTSTFQLKVLSNEPPANGR